MEFRKNQKIEEVEKIEEEDEELEEDEKIEEDEKKDVEIVIEEAKDENTFYTFMEMLDPKYLSVIMAKFHEIVPKIQFYDLAKDNPGAYNDLEVIMADVKDHLVKRISFGYGANFKINEKMLDNIQCVTIARLSCFMDENAFRITLKEVHNIIVPCIVGVMSLKNFAENKHYIEQFIHATRGLLDSGNPFESALITIKLINDRLVEKYILDNNETQALNEALKFWKGTVIGSKAFQKALGQFKRNYALEIGKETLTKHLENMQIVVVTSAIYSVGFNGIILSSGLFRGMPKTYNIVVRKILRVLIHECAHYLLRLIRDDFGLLTPRNHDKDEKIQEFEAGYLMEQIIFGDGSKENWYVNLMEEKRWKKSTLPIVTKTESKKLPDRSNRQCASGFLLADEEFVL
jgi:hypothetical protein